MPGAKNRMNSIWDIINIPFGYVLRFCNWIAQNQYILALLIFAVIVEVVLLPFGIKQQKNSIKQAKLRPKEMAIRKKYAGRDDTPTKQKMTQEIQELYQKEGFNPMGGCLPLLIQFPIIIALYNIVLNPLHYVCGLSNDAVQRVITIVSGLKGGGDYTASRTINLLGDMKSVISEHGIGVFSGVEGFSDRIQSAADLPNFSFFGGAINLADTPSFKSLNWLILIPILTFVAYFFSMKINRKLMYQPAMDNQQMGCSNNMMDLMMPLMSVFIAFTVPAAIGVYWIFKCLVGVGKQAILRAAMPIPTFTEEDYKKAEKEAGARPEKTVRQSSGKTVRSLHHIDDEDFPDTAPAAKARREAMEEEKSETVTTDPAKDAELSRFAAPVKEDKSREERKKEKKDKKDKKEKHNRNNDITGR